MLIVYTLTLISRSALKATNIKCNLTACIPVISSLNPQPSHRHDRNGTRRQDGHPPNLPSSRLSSLGTYDFRFAPEMRSEPRCADSVKRYGRDPLLPEFDIQPAASVGHVASTTNDWEIRNPLCQSCSKQPCLAKSRPPQAPEWDPHKENGLRAARHSQLHRC